MAAWNEVIVNRLLWTLPLLMLMVGLGLLDAVAQTPKGATEVAREKQAPAPPAGEETPAPTPGEAATPELDCSTVRAGIEDVLSRAEFCETHQQCTMWSTSTWRLDLAALRHARMHGSSPFNRTRCDTSNVVPHPSHLSVVPISLVRCARRAAVNSHHPVN